MNPAGRSLPELKISTSLFLLPLIKSEPHVSVIIAAVSAEASTIKIFKFASRMEPEEKLRPQGGGRDLARK